MRFLFWKGLIRFGGDRRCISGGRTRPGCIIWCGEILDNAIDEVINGYATTITVELDKNGGGIRVTDNGRGIPVDQHKKYKKSALEIIMTTLHAGGKFETGSYIHSGGLHGVGASVVNALSDHLEVTVKRHGHEWQQRYQAGKPLGPVTKGNPARGTGTSVYFRPDPIIFGKQTTFDSTLLQHTLEAKSYLHKGLKLAFKDGPSRQTYDFVHEQGIEEYLTKLVRDRGHKPHRRLRVLLRTPLGRQWQTRDKQRRLRHGSRPAMDGRTRGNSSGGYVNGVGTSSGGTHESGLRTGIVKVVRHYMETHNLTPKGLNIQAEDIREGMACVLSVLILNPQFQGQTKERLNNPEVQGLVDNALRPSLENFLHENQNHCRDPGRPHDSGGARAGSIP